MKNVLSLCLLAAFAFAFAAAEDKPRKVGIEESTVRADGFVDVEKMTEHEFLSSPDTPKLYPMDKALEVAKLQNKPVLCWMGKNAFADPNVRKLSMQLKATTVQASMEKDPDNPKYDQFNPRVKFDTNQYLNGGKTYFIRAENFKFESPSTPVEQTTAYRIMKMIDSKEQPDGVDPLAKPKVGK